MDANQLPHLDYFTKGKQGHFPGQLPEDSEEIKTYNLAGSVGTIVHAIQKTVQDIQHQIFRLGRLGGMKGEAFQAFADQVGSACRSGKQKIFERLAWIGLIHESYVDVFAPLDDSICTRPEVFIADSVGHATSIVLESKKHSDFEKGKLHSPQNLPRDVFADLFPAILLCPICRVGMDDLMDSMVRLATFAFDDGENPHRRRGNIFIECVEKVVFEAITSLLGLWASVDLIKPCECLFTKDKQWRTICNAVDYGGNQSGGRPKHNGIVLNKWQVFGTETRSENYCPKCWDWGVVFAERVFSTLPPEETERVGSSDHISTILFG